MKPLYYCLALAAVSFAVTTYASDDAKEDWDRFTFDFSGGKGAPGNLKREGTRLDDNTPFQKDKNFVVALGPQDHVALKVIPPPKLVGKILAYHAKFVKIRRESRWIFFSKEIRDNATDRDWKNQIEKTVEVGDRSKELKVIVEVRYHTKPKHRYCYSPQKPIDLILERGGGVFVFLEVPNESVAWEDDPNPKLTREEQDALDAQMRGRQRAGGYNEAHMLGRRVQRGNVGELKAVLTATRKK
jgi:hypothetical protein